MLPNLSFLSFHQLRICRGVADAHPANSSFEKLEPPASQLASLFARAHGRNTHVPRHFTPEMQVPLHLSHFTQITLHTPVQVQARPRLEGAPTGWRRTSIGAAAAVKTQPASAAPAAAAPVTAGTVVAAAV